MPDSPISIEVPSLPFSLMIWASACSISDRGVSASCSALAECLPTLVTDVSTLDKRSSSTNFSQAERNGSGVSRSPMPMTYMPDSRRRMASLVKSLSLAGSQTEAAYMTRIENIHGIYDHGRISGIFTCRIAVLLYRVDGIG